MAVVLFQAPPKAGWCLAELDDLTVVGDPEQRKRHGRKKKQSIEKRKIPHVFIYVFEGYLTSNANGHE